MTDAMSAVLVLVAFGVTVLSSLSIGVAVMAYRRQP